MINTRVADKGDACDGTMALIIIVFIMSLLLSIVCLDNTALPTNVYTWIDYVVYYNITTNVHPFINLAVVLALYFLPVLVGLNLKMAKFNVDMSWFFIWPSYVLISAYEILAFVVINLFVMPGILIGLFRDFKFFKRPHCPQCQNKISANGKFCSNCGIAV